MTGASTHGSIHGPPHGVGNESGNSHGSGLRRSLLVLALVVASGVAAVPLLGVLVERPVLSVRVAGEFQRVDRSELERAVRPQLEGRGFFQLDVESVRAAAMALPWIREATVRRVWPDSIHIAVVERMAVARWNETALLENDAQVFVPRTGVETHRLAHLRGPAGREAEVLARYKRLAVGLGGLAGGVSRVSLSARGEWEIAFAQGLTLVPQSPLDVAALEDFGRALPRLLGDRLEQAERIDLRYANGFAVRWRDAGDEKVAGESQGGRG